MHKVYDEALLCLFKEMGKSSYTEKSAVSVAIFQLFFLILTPPTP